MLIEVVCSGFSEPECLSTNWLYSWNWCSTLDRGPFIFRYHEDEISNDSALVNSALKGDVAKVHPHRNTTPRDRTDIAKIWYTEWIDVVWCSLRNGSRVYCELRPHSTAIRGILQSICHIPHCDSIHHLYCTLFVFIWILEVNIMVRQCIVDSSIQRGDTETNTSGKPWKYHTGTNMN